MKPLLFVFLLVVPLLSCQTPVKPAQDDPALRHQIHQSLQAFELEAAASALLRYQQQFPASNEVAVLRSALAQRYLDKGWRELAVAEGGSEPNVKLQVLAELTQAETLGAPAQGVTELKAALLKHFPEPTLIAGEETAARTVAKQADATPNGAPKPQAAKTVKKPKTKSPKAADTASVAAPAMSGSAAAAPAATVAQIPARREIRLNQADVEARSDVVASMLKQISKHIVREPVNVVIQSRSMKDFRWINALLKTSIQELDAGYKLSSEPVVDPAAAPSVILLAR